MNLDRRSAIRSASILALTLLTVLATGLVTPFMSVCMRPDGRCAAVPACSAPLADPGPCCACIEPGTDADSGGPCGADAFAATDSRCCRHSDISQPFTETRGKTAPPPALAVAAPLGEPGAPQAGPALTERAFFAAPIHSVARSTILRL